MQSRLAAQLAVLISSTAVLAASCSGEDGEKGAQGAPGTPGTSGDSGSGCTVTDNGDGTKTITCADGTKVTVSDGDGGISGTGCTAVQEDGGAITVTCGDASVTIGGPGQPDAALAAPGPGLKVDAKASAPANGTHFAAGEKITLTFELKDGKGNPLSLADLKRANLYLNGPRDMVKNKTASALLKAETDRSKAVHHYVDLKTTTNPNLVVSGNKLTYTTEAVGSEDPGTYTAALWAESAAAPLDQVFQMVDVQIGTATVEPIVIGGCADCHEGAANKKMYLHHIDPGYSPAGNPALDATPIQGCKACHNQDGYAAIRKCADGSKPVSNGANPPKYLCVDGTENHTWLVDPIIRRVHGVHMGEELLSTFNTNATWGDFMHYTEAVFPYNVKNCTKCHTDDSWKTKPTRAACGACHDNLNFTNGKYEPPKSYVIPITGGTGGKCTADTQCGVGKCDTASGVCKCQSNTDCANVFTGFSGVCNSGTCQLVDHMGGSATDDTGCKSCHQADTGGAAISVKHKVVPLDYPESVTITMTAPANGTHYVAGEAPVVTLVYKTKAGAVIDPNTMTEAAKYTGTYLFVNGPRGNRIPGLTSAARPETTSTVAGPWDLSAATDLQLKVGNKTLKVVTTTAVKKAGATAAEVVAWLNADAAFKTVAFATLAKGSTTAVTLLAKPSVSRTALEILSSTVGTALGFTPGVYTEKSASGSYAANALYRHTNASADDPKATYSATDIKYQLDDVATVEPGTYSIWARVGVSGKPQNWELLNFQVGTATVEKKIATNCASCHGDKKGETGMHGLYGWDADICGSCHDYRRPVADRTASDTFVDGWGASAASGRSNMGFGAGPLSRRVHGVHFSHYVNNVKEIHSSWTDAIIFPQDLRNCVKCHADNTSWKTKPSRMACFGCHDSSAATSHGTLMTLDMTPVDAWNGDEKESCATCHGAGKELSVEAVHDITNPYVPPYPRE